MQIIILCNSLFICIYCSYDMCDVTQTARSVLYIRLCVCVNKQQTNKNVISLTNKIDFYCIPLGLRLLPELECGFTPKLDITTPTHIFMLISLRASFWFLLRLFFIEYLLQLWHSFACMTVLSTTTRPALLGILESSRKRFRFHMP